jgi:sugar lactone lactonase YvrE
MGNRSDMRIFSLSLALTLGVAPLALFGQFPMITGQPAGQVVWKGGNVTFFVAASGGGPLTYQWKCNGTNLPNGLITTVAGGGVADGGAATNANLYSPFLIAADSSGNLFIADNGNHRVRKLGTNGIIATVAGSGITGYSGDGGAATAAGIDPASVAVDSSGNLFIADNGNNRIRKVGTNGIISTVAGNGTPGYSGEGRAVTNALKSPQGVAVDASGNLFIADTGNQRVRKVSPDGIMSTVAGKGTAGFSGDGGAATNAMLDIPYAVAVDASGNLLIVDTGNDRVRKVDAGGVITTVAGNGPYGYGGDGGPAVFASLSVPYGLVVDASSNLLIADSSNYRIRKVNPAGIITTLAGNGTRGYSGDGDFGTNASFYYPVGVAVDASGNLFIADIGNHVIRKLSPDNIVTTVAGNGARGYSGDGGLAANASLDFPYNVAVDASGCLFIADHGNVRIRKVNTNGIITTLAGNGVRGYSGDGGAATGASLCSPDGLSVGASGSLFLAEDLTNRIRKVDSNGTITTVAGKGTAGYSGDGGAATNASLYFPYDVAVDASGNLFIADEQNRRIRKVDPGGIITPVAGKGTAGYSGDGGAATNASMDPVGVAVDASGQLFIADYNNHRVRKVDTGGIITTVAGTGAHDYSGDGGPATTATLNFPADVTVDRFGNLFIADEGNNRVRKVGTNGIITTVAGNGPSGLGTGGYSGDGVLATTANLSEPIGVAVDGFGNLFIADYSNNRIRKVTSTQGPGLALNNVTAADSGNYEVVVTGPGGKTNSSVATLIVATVPLIYAIGSDSGGNVTLRFVSRPGSTNVVCGTASLGVTEPWQPLSTNIAGPDGHWQFADPPAAGSSARFYRSLMQ